LIAELPTGSRLGRFGNILFARSERTESAISTPGEERSHAAEAVISGLVRNPANLPGERADLLIKPA
jgi:hypothetical protein